MNNKLRKIISAALLAGLTAGGRVSTTLLAKREAELQMLNNELYVYGYRHFEPSLSNARWIVAYERDRRKTYVEFAQIIHDNFHH